MVAPHRTPAAFWLVLFFLTSGTATSPCPNCSKDFDLNNLFCSFSTPESQRYTLKITDYDNGEENLLSYRCHHTAKYVEFTFHKGCNFSTVQYVIFERCPLFNVSFSEIFTELGILPKKVLALTFENVGTRKNMKLESWHLDGLTNLQRLELKNNLFTSIPPDLLDATPNLQQFLLSLNNMSTLPETLFASQSNLTTINLISNNFKSLPANLFANISTLTTLTVYSNALGQISPNLLSSIPAVRRLELSFNQITKLSSDTFMHLPRLQSLYLKFNYLESLPDDIFHNCPDLQTVHLHNNKLRSLPSQLFLKSKNITDFNFRYNKVTEIPPGLFQGLRNLTMLSMTGNSIGKIPEGSFTDLINVKELSLQNNPLKTLPPGCFDNLRKVKALLLGNTSLIHLPDNIFKNCEALEELNLSDNHLSELKSTCFPHPVTVLSTLYLGKNNLSFSAITSKPQGRETTEEILVEQFPLSDQVKLTALFLQDNRIRVIPHALRNLRHLKRLDLRNNSIEYLDYLDLLGSDHATSIGNNVSQIVADNPNIPKTGVQVELGDNPLICDCHLYDFSRLLQEKISEEQENTVHLHIVDKAELKCSPPNDHSVQQLVMTLDISTLTCYRKECHPSCSCATRPHDNMFIMDCAHQDLQAIPEMRPYIPQGNYSITLNLNNNSITSLEGLQSPEYSNLVNLTIPYNHLKLINESYLPKTLNALDVSNNALTYFSPSLINFLNITNANLSLGGNPWLCDCHLVDLYTFLRDPLRKLDSSRTILCSNLNKPLLSLTEEELCPTIQQPMVVVTIASTTVFLFLFFVLGTVSVYKYQQDIKVWLFTHQICLWAVAKEEAEASKKYDAFISYSNKDEDYVNTVLVPGLECGEPKYRVCLHYRDWVPGEYIQNQIDQSIEDSHRTIVILSSNFIENVWGHIEFKTAHSKALKEKSKKIIVIVLGQVPPESEMDEELKLYLSTRTYLQSDHPKFWENLRYAMPHPQEFLQKKRIKTKKTERLELVQTNAKPR